MRAQCAGSERSKCAPTLSTAGGGVQACASVRLQQPGGKEVEDELDRSVNEWFALIRRLIDIPSVTGEEGDLARELERWLAERGYAVTLQPVEGDRYNVWATLGDPRVVMCTHLDTVPPFIASSEDDEHIRGRGSCDAKGVMVSMLAATERLRAGGEDRIGLLFTVGEELDSIGARRAFGLAVAAHHTIIGEPTENRLATGHKGTLKFRLRATGTAAHSAYPHLGDSAIDALLEALAEIRRTDWGNDDRLGPATVNIGTLDGGVAENVVAPHANAGVFVRVVGKADDARQKLESILAGRDSLSYEIVAESDAVFCETRDGFETAPVSFGTDIPSLDPSKFGKPLLVGPGSIHDAHTAHEFIPKAAVVEAIDLYERLARELLELS